MTAVEIYSWVAGGLLVIFIALSPTVFRRWFRAKIFCKDIVRLCLAMLIGLGGIYVMALLLALLPLIADYGKSAYLGSAEYVALVGNDTGGIFIGYTVIVVAFMFGILLAMLNLPYWLIPHSEEEKNLQKESSIWLKGKFPKFLRGKSA